MKLNWNFLGGEQVQNKKPSMGGVWIFCGTTHYIKHFSILLMGDEVSLSDLACSEVPFSTLGFTGFDGSAA